MLPTPLPTSRLPTSAPLKSITAIGCETDPGASLRARPRIRLGNRVGTPRSIRGRGVVYRPTNDCDNEGPKMTDPTDDEEYSDDAQRDEQAERIGDALRDGDIVTAVDELADARNYVVHVEQDDNLWVYHGDESNIVSALSAVSKHFDSVHVEIKKHRSNTHFGTGEMPA